ncbi:hypothetical protein ACNKXS_11115, partial [Christiangramia marina]|uniref:hypothetical protein n=1 Tax=Christiangramia marina TaxID=409436 RepID=UPI003AA958BF
VQAMEIRDPASKISNVGEQRDNLFSIQVSGNTLRVNGVKTNPDKLSETLDKLSGGKTDEELKNYNFRMQVMDPAPGFMESLNSEFRKSRMSKVSGHDILPPPPPVHRDEDFQVPRPPKPPKSAKPQNAPKPPKPPKSLKGSKSGKDVTNEEELAAAESLEINYVKEEKDVKNQYFKNKSKFKDKNKQKVLPNPPVPPTAPDPLRTIKEVYAEGGSFFYNGKKISAKKATKIIESKNYTNIYVNQTGDSEGLMKITGSR